MAKLGKTKSDEHVWKAQDHTKDTCTKSWVTGSHNKNSESKINFMLSVHCYDLSSGLQKPFLGC